MYYRHLKHTFALQYGFEILDVASFRNYSALKDKFGPNYFAPMTPSAVKIEGEMSKSTCLYSLAARHHRPLDGTQRLPTKGWPG